MQALEHLPVARSQWRWLSDLVYRVRGSRPMQLCAPKALDSVAITAACAPRINQRIVSTLCLCECVGGVH